MAAIGGEWYIEAGDGYPAEPKTKRFVYATQPDGERYIVAKVWADGGDYESTARLVAAAPDLLAAVRAAVNALNVAPRFLCGGTTSYAVAAMCDQAIAKAEGRTDDQ